MQPLPILRANRRITAALMMFCILLSGQLFCVMAVNGLETNSTESSSATSHSSHPCCPDSKGKMTSSVNMNCCLDPASFCCGEAKAGSNQVQIEDFQPSLLQVFVFTWFEPLFVESVQQTKLWVEDIVLRRTGPPIHLLNCTFLD